MFWLQKYEKRFKWRDFSMKMCNFVPKFLIFIKIE